jgi:hypothetical protein
MTNNRRTLIKDSLLEIVDANVMQWYRPTGGHREEGVEFKRLFSGEEGAADNYWFTLVQVREKYHTPAHRHMFDQVRIMLKGGFNFGDQEQVEGSFGYFTEGTEYTQKCDSYSYHLLLQCEGASHTRYFSGPSTRAATDALKQEGHFKDGQYHHAQSGEVMDGYEAIYENLTGTRPKYTAPRYERPIIMEPQLFEWVDDRTQPGLKWRRLGTFNERELQLSCAALVAGADVEIMADDAALLLFATKGDGVAGDVPWVEGSAIRLQPGERAALKANSDAEFHVIRLPRP